MLLNKQDHNHTRPCSPKGAVESSGYTLVDVIVTVFIMGTILLVVNVILISLVRVSYNTDTRIKVRQGLEFALEVTRRNSKSVEPGEISVVSNPACGDAGDPNCDAYPEALWMRLSESDSYVTFYVEMDSDADDFGVLKAAWVRDEVESTVHLTSSADINVKSYDVDVIPDPESGTTEVLVTITAASAHMKSPTEPLIDNVIKQMTILTRNSEL